jgi:hypothetical protein
MIPDILNVRTIPDATLRSALEQEGFLSSRAAVVSVVTRLLRPGSSPQTDAMMALVNRD